MFAAPSRAQPTQSTLQITVFSRSIPRYGRRGFGGASCFFKRFKSPQREQVEIGIFPLARSSRNFCATGPKKISSNEFFRKSPRCPLPS